MRSNTYDIILTGETTDGLTIPAASRKLAALSNMNEAQARAVFKRAPLAVKKNVNEDTAKRFQRAFAQAHIKVSLQVSRAHSPTAQGMSEHEFGTRPPSIVKETVIDAPSPSARVKTTGLAFKTEGSKAFGLLSVVLPEGQTLWVDSTSVVSSDAHIRLNSHDTSIRRLKGAAGIYISEYTSLGAEGEISLSPNLPGEIVHMLLYQQSVHIKSSVFLASAAGVSLDETHDRRPKTRDTGHKLRCHGTGDLWLQVCGSVLELEVHDRYCVRPCHLIAWTEGMQLEPCGTPLGENLINVTGRGKVWLQTQSSESLTAWAAQFRSNAPP